MSLRTMTTVAVDCDGCDEVLIDTVPYTEKQALATAERLGWTYTDDEKDLCPACSAKRRHLPTSPEHAA